MKEADTLIRTKLRVPFTRPVLVPRPRLHEQIAQGLRGPLTLITAPAGFGKTTLVASCVAGSGLPTAWLSLDTDDNQADRFLRYLVAALQQANAAIGGAVRSEAARLLAAGEEVPAEAVLSSLINDLDIASEQMALVLDDYHVISNQAVHQAVTLLLEHCPSCFHLVIITRSDPPLPLSRLRARGQMIELRAADLRFTESEAAQFLNKVMGLRLDAGSVSALEERTEGWIAGLQMAALSMHEREDVSGFIEGFSGTNRYIMDYLLEEVLASQPPGIQWFLLRTSILDRLTAPLCDAVLADRETGRSVTDDQFAILPAHLPSNVPDSQQILEYLERANLFLLPLDDERIWYRYHHLFTSLLRSRLRLLLEPAAIQELHRRAGQWYEGQGLMPEAIDQALEAPDPEYAADLLEREILPFFYQSEIAQIHRWLELLPKPLILQRPLLCAIYAASISMLPPYPPESIVTAESWMQAAEDGLPSRGSDGDLARAFIYKMRSYWARWCNEPPDIVLRLIADARSALPDDPDHETNPNWLYIRSALQSNLALAYWAAGDEQAAKQAFMESRRISSACEDLLNAAQSSNHLITIHFLHGQLGEAAKLCRESLTFLDQHQARLGHPVPFSGEIGIGLAEIQIEQNELADVERIVKENLELAKWTMGKNILLRGNLALARLAAAEGNTAAAFEYLREAEQISEEGAALAGAQRARLWLALGSREPEFLNLVRQWAKNLRPVEFNQSPPQAEWTISLALAHLIIWEADSSQAEMKSPVIHLSELLDWQMRQVQTMQDRGWAHWELQLLVLESLTWQTMRDLSNAKAALEQALELASAGGYVRVFLEEGRPMQSLLAKWLAHASPGPLRDYANHLLSQFDAEPHGVTRAQEKASPAGGLVEPLSGRELEVLQLVAMGRTNQEIAQRLIVAPGTVKAHTASIYRKLDVTNRTESVARARQLGILP